MKKEYSSATSTYHHQVNRQSGFDSQNRMSSSDLRLELHATWLPELSACHLTLHKQPELLLLQPSPQCLSSSTLIPPTQATSTHLCQPGGRPPARMQPQANGRLLPVKGLQRSAPAQASELRPGRGAAEQRCLGPRLSQEEELCCC